MAEWVSAIAAVAAAVFAGAAWVVAWRAHKHSGRAADAAEVSAKAATETALIAKVEASRMAERHDVDWEFVEQPANRRSCIEFRNIGLSAAHSVEAALDLDDVRVEIRCGTVLPGHTFTHDATDCHQVADRRWQEGLEAGFLGTPGIDVKARILWTSELGTPGIWTGGGFA